MIHLHHFQKLVDTKRDESGTVETVWPDRTQELGYDLVPGSGTDEYLWAIRYRKPVGDCRCTNRSCFDRYGLVVTVQAADLEQFTKELQELGESYPDIAFETKYTHTTKTPWVNMNGLSAK